MENHIISISYMFHDQQPATIDDAEMGSDTYPSPCSPGVYWVLLYVDCLILKIWSLGGFHLVEDVVVN